MVRRFVSDDHSGLALFRDTAASSQTAIPLTVGLNELIFGGMAVISIAAFLFIGRYRANADQRDRDNRIDWSHRIWRSFKKFRR